ncbi:MAG: hypothetical protein O3A25_10475 [Acidobacteria bacterium]|nr:hypothetical protein [Acidobacteriota bacterium]
MSPILVRPIREQFEHNRVIRLLAAKFRKKYAVGVNIGDEPEASGVRSRNDTVYPDLVLTTVEGGRRLHGVIEVETAESVNHLEAMAEWARYGRVRGAFYLYVPAASAEVARRLCSASAVTVSEIWGYHAVGEKIRFTMTYRSARATLSGRRAAKASPAAASPRSTTTAARKPTAKTSKTTTKRAATVEGVTARPAAGAKAAPKAKSAPKVKTAGKPKTAQRTSTSAAKTAKPRSRR